MHSVAVASEEHKELNKWLWFVLSIVVIALDQWTKWIASTNLDYGQPVQVFSLLNFTLWHNTGAAFSFLNDAGGWQRWFFAVVSAAVSVVLIVWMYRLPDKQKLLMLALALILGGAIGNLYDRLMLGYVVDFISVHYANHYFPTFNVADSAISVGACLMLLDMFLNRHADSASE